MKWKETQYMNYSSLKEPYVFQYVVVHIFKGVSQLRNNLTLVLLDIPRPLQYMHQRNILLHGYNFGPNIYGFILMTVRMYLVPFVVLRQNVFKLNHL